MDERGHERRGLLLRGFARCTPFYWRRMNFMLMRLAGDPESEERSHIGKDRNIIMIP